MAAPESEPKFSTIREAFCAYYRCRADAFEHKAFWKTLYPHAVLPAIPIWLFNRRFFHADLETIRQFGACRNPAEFAAVMSEFSTANLLERTIRRGRLRIRVSGTRVLGMFNRLRDYLHPSDVEMIEEYVRHSNASESATTKKSVRMPTPSLKESPAVMLRKLRQAHEELVAGGDKNRVLERIGMTEDALLEALGIYGGGTPGLVWLRDGLLREQHLKRLELENAQLNRAVARLTQELDDVRRGTPQRDRAPLV